MSGTSDKRVQTCKDVFTHKELEKLFPPDINEFRKIWKSKDYRSEPYKAGQMFGTMVCVMVLTGLRSGVARALHKEQVLPKLSGLIIDRAYDSLGILTTPKKGTAADPRQRAVVIPDRTMKLLKGWAWGGKGCSFNFTESLSHGITYWIVSKSD